MIRREPRVHQIDHRLWRLLILETGLRLDRRKCRYQKQKNENKKPPRPRTPHTAANRFRPSVAVNLHISPPSSPGILQESASILPSNTNPRNLFLPRENTTREVDSIIC